MRDIEAKTGTFIEAEELAYPLGSLNASRRRFSARCPDGIIRSGICSIPDTYFSIPARLRVKGKSVVGYITAESEDSGTTIIFIANQSCPNHALVEEKTMSDSVASAVSGLSVYVHIARLLNTIGDMKVSKPLVSSWERAWPLVLADMVKAYLPSGSGIDAGVKLDDRSTRDRIVLTFGFHFMDDNGCYDGWESYTLYVRPSLAFGIDLKLVGPNRNDIKDCLYETFDYALRQVVPDEAYRKLVRDNQNSV